jgi:chromosome segregation ATPase
MVGGADRTFRWFPPHVYTVLLGKGFNVMMKKILIAAVAVVAGLAVLNLSLVRVWWKDCCFQAKRMVPPDVRLKQLNHEIENIDKDIATNLGKLARMEVDVKMFEEQLNAKRDRQVQLRGKIGDMQKSLEARAEHVVYQGRKTDATRLTNQLDMAVVEFNGLKEQVKVQEQLLTDKKRTLEAAHSRITAMKNEKEKLRQVAVKLETHLELVKMKQIQNQDITFDEGAITNAQQIAKDVEVQLREAEMKTQLLKQYGYAEKAPVEPENKSREEVLRSARAALEDDAQPAEQVAEKK